MEDNPTQETIKKDLNWHEESDIEELQLEEARNRCNSTLVWLIIKGLFVAAILALLLGTALSK